MRNGIKSEWPLFQLTWPVAVGHPSPRPSPARGEGARVSEKQRGHGLAEELGVVAGCVVWEFEEQEKYERGDHAERTRGPAVEDGLECSGGDEEGGEDEHGEDGDDGGIDGDVACDAGLVAARAGGGLEGEREDGDDGVAADAGVFAEDEADLAVTLSGAEEVGLVDGEEPASGFVDGETGGEVEGLAAEVEGDEGFEVGEHGVDTGWGTGVDGE